MFSLVPRCHGLRGSQKYTATPGVDAEADVLGHLLAVVPSERAPQLGWKRSDVHAELVDNVFGPSALGKADQHQEAGLAFDEGGDLAVPTANQQVALPVTGHGTVVDLGGPLAYGDGADDLAPSVPVGAVRSWAASDPARAEMGGELFGQHPSGLHEQRQIDRLVRHPHLRIIGERPAEPACDLLGRPVQCELAGHELAQPPVGGEPAHLRSARSGPGRLVALAAR